MSDTVKVPTSEYLALKRDSGLLPASVKECNRLRKGLADFLTEVTAAWACRDADLFRRAVDKARAVLEGKK